MTRAALTLFVLIASCSSPGFQNRLLATIPSDVEVSIPPAFAPNGRSVAFVARSGDGDRAIRDGWRSARFDFICCLSISDDGRRVAFLGNDDRGANFVVDDEILPAYPVEFSGDGTVVAYPLQGRIVVSGVAGPEFDGVGFPSLSRDGRVVAYRVQRGDRSQIRFGDREGPPFARVTDPVVSADGSTVAYGAEDAEGSLVFAGDRKVRVERLPFQVFISDDGRLVGWIASESKPEGGSRLRVVSEGSKGEAFGLVGKPVVSPTAPLVAYGAEEGGRKVVVIGDRKVETPNRISDVSFSPDGRFVGYGARIGRELWWKVIEVH